MPLESELSPALTPTQTPSFVPSLSFLFCAKQFHSLTAGSIDSIFFTSYVAKESICLLARCCLPLRPRPSWPRSTLPWVLLSVLVRQPMTPSSASLGPRLSFPAPQATTMETFHYGSGWELQTATLSRVSRRTGPATTGTFTHTLSCRLEVCSSVLRANL